MTAVDSGADGDLLISLAVKQGMELKERALALQQKGQEIAEWGQGKTQVWKEQIESANPMVEELKGALLKESPIDTQSLSRDRELLSSYIATASILAAFAVGEIVGKWTGFLLLSWWLSTGVTLITMLAVIPAVYASLKRGQSPPSPEEQYNYELVIGVVLGVLNGFNLSNYPAISILPLAIVPMAQAATIRWVAPMVGQDRKAVIGVVAGAWMAPCLILGLIFGLNLACVTLWIGAAAASGAIFQLVLYKKEGNAQWLADFANLAILESAIIAKTLLTVVMLKTYEQLRQNPPPPPPQNA